MSKVRIGYDVILVIPGKHEDHVMPGKVQSVHPDGACDVVYVVENGEHPELKIESNVYAAENTPETSRASHYYLPGEWYAREDRMAEEALNPVAQPAEAPIDPVPGT